MRSKRLISVLGSGLLMLAPLIACAAGVGSHAVVFVYHHFGVDEHPSTNVRLDQLEAHTVALTMDDAYLSVYTEAYPRLRGRGWPFTVFVSTDHIDRGYDNFVSTDHIDRGYDNYMSWDPMREMQRRGATFANHSASHGHLIRRRNGKDRAVWARRVRADIRRAQSRLEEELGAAPALFAYPFGEYGEALAEIVAELGLAGLGQHSGAIGGHSDLRALPRYPMAGAYAGLEQFRTKAASLALPVVRVEPWDPVLEGETRPRMVAALAPSDTDLDRLACFASGQGRIPVERLGDGACRFATRAEAALPAGRSRYNCTAPSQQAERFSSPMSPASSHRDATRRGATARCSTS